MDNQIEIYQTADNNTQIEVKFDKDNVWLSQEQIVLLFERDQSVISRHINNVFKEKELDRKSNMQKLHIANSDKLFKSEEMGIVKNLIISILNRR